MHLESESIAILNGFGGKSEVHRRYFSQRSSAVLTVIFSCNFLLCYPAQSTSQENDGSAPSGTALSKSTQCTETIGSIIKSNCQPYNNREKYPNIANTTVSAISETKQLTSDFQCKLKLLCCAGSIRPLGVTLNVPDNDPKMHIPLLEGLVVNFMVSGLRGTALLFNS
jgi:hypothetical protein